MDFFFVFVVDSAIFLTTSVEHSSNSHSLKRFFDLQRLFTGCSLFLYFQKNFVLKENIIFIPFLSTPSAVSHLIRYHAKTRSHRFELLSLALNSTQQIEL